MAENNEQLLDLYDIMLSLRRRTPDEANLMAAMDKDEKLYIIFNFPDVVVEEEHGAHTAKPFQVLLDTKKDIREHKASDIMHLAFAKLRSYIRSGYQESWESQV